MLLEWEVEIDGLFVLLRSSGVEWVLCVWVELVMWLLVEGIMLVFVGMRQMLGEGWDCLLLNVFVDLSVVIIGVLVQ